MENKKIYYGLSIFAFLLIFYVFFISPPSDFPPNTIVKIESGMSLRSVSSLLKKDHLVRSRLAFEVSMRMLGGEKHIISAYYLFENKLSVWEIARRIRFGEHHMPPVAVTIPEGFELKQISEAFVIKLINFNKINFLTIAQSLEGYLFPDTYFFLTNANETDVIKSMNDNFQKKVAPLLLDITAFGKSEKDIITMASIVEREAKGDADRGVIAGILWKRIAIGMALQVDAAPETYKVRGLPQGPISNPGLEAIKAAIHPQSSPYLYYLHDKNGVIHYARNFAEHSANIAKYLK